METRTGGLHLLVLGIYLFLLVLICAFLLRLSFINGDFPSWRTNSYGGGVEMGGDGKGLYGTGWESHPTLPSHLIPFHWNLGAVAFSIVGSTLPPSLNPEILDAGSHVAWCPASVDQ